MLGLHLPVTTDHSKPTHVDDTPSDEDAGDKILNIRTDIVDETDRAPDVTPDIASDDTSNIVSANEIRSVLLYSHKSLLEDILIMLLSSDSHHKWITYNCVQLYEFAFSSTTALYNAMTNHDLDIVIGVL